MKKVLDKIYICRMLKKESRDLDAKYKTKRENTVIDTIDKIFINECKIEIYNWEEEKNKLLKENQG